MAGREGGMDGWMDEEGRGQPSQGGVKERR